MWPWNQKLKPKPCALRHKPIWGQYAKPGSRSEYTLLLFIRREQDYWKVLLFIIGLSWKDRSDNITIIMCKQFFEAKVWSPLASFMQPRTKRSQSWRQQAAEIPGFQEPLLLCTEAEYIFTCFSMRSRSSRKDTFLLQKHILFFSHFKEIIFIKQNMN